MPKVNVYLNEEDRQYGGEVVARVKYNQRLDYWNGSDWTNGGVGRHLGITKLRDGSFVLIYGTQWEGERDYGLVVSDRKALDAILRSGNEELLEETRFGPLKELAEKVLITEMIA